MYSTHKKGKVRNGEGHSNRGKEQCIKGEKGNRIQWKQGMVHLRKGRLGKHETLNGNTLEGEVCWVSLPNKEDHYITPST